MNKIKKTILTLVALLAVTTGAWAEGTVYNTTVALKDLKAGDVLTDGFKLTTDKGQYIYVKGYKKDGGTAETGDYTQLNAYNSTFPGGVTISVSGSTYTPYADGKDANAWIVSDWKDFGSATMLYLDGYNYTPSSAVEVDWNKAEKSGTFTMPGGNVELEPEYYPQAAFATGGAPTAINDVPATTDGAIVNAGTVANIGETANAQGTVMYYVSTTALDDAALLALAADAWTADVPTAQSFTAAGQAYVYYYVRGNDSDTDEEIFSDGDILSANALTVNIAAAPTYAVTFAEGVNPEPPAEPEWTASPNTGLKQGDKVTVTYTGSKKVIGVKAEKKAAAAGIVNPVVGQIIGSDGKNYDANATLPTGVTAVAKIFYVGSETGEAAPYNHGLALALSDANGGSGCKWNTENTDAGHTKQGSSTFTEESGLQYNDATHNSDTYPAFKAAIANNGTAAPTGCSAWFLASGYQWQKMIDAVGLANLGLTEYAYYWSSSENDPDHAWDFEGAHDGDWSNSSKDYDDLVRACLAF